ncbi:opsin 7, group member a isoform X2 [Clupea harengus]|uniref:Opsin 7, group member a isoform X2 n=1 Tax=Clupea harengus TaxID=7950 RepID=A0A6P8G697_CLUHA|nr:opsin 7, group member a isoform X2 [Clupea harengus]XP_042564781.1 opsin 7, group member a isoform X2 [Clupea harengus]
MYGSGVCSLCGNSVLLYISYRKRHLLKPAELFIVNLALSDLCMTLTLYPMAVTSSFYHRWLFGRDVCLFYAFCGVLFGLCSLTTLTILSTVCCLKVCYPVYGNRFTHRHGSVLAACAWGYALLFACSPLARWGSFGPEPYGTACCIDWGRSSHEPLARSYTVALFLCCYVLPCALISSSYTLILLTMRHSRRALRRHSHKRVHLHTQTRMGNIQIVIVKLSVAVCIGFLVAWSPYAVVSMWAAFGHFEDIPPLAFAVPALFAKSSPLYNPLVYLLLKPNFRRDLHSLLQACVCVRCCHKSGCPHPCSTCVHVLHSLHQRAESAAGLGQPMSGVEQCVCEHCHDPFEHFRHYPRGCRTSVNTVQLSLEPMHTHAAPPPCEHLHATHSHTHTHSGRDPQHPVRVVVRGKKSMVIDSLEITLETLQSST